MLYQDYLHSSSDMLIFLVLSSWKMFNEIPYLYLKSIYLNIVTAEQEFTYFLNSILLIILLSYNSVSV